MLYHVRMDVRPPPGVDPAAFERLKAEEKARAQELQRSGKWVHLWRIAGQYLEYLGVRRREPRRAARPPLRLAALSLYGDRGDAAGAASLGHRG